MVSIQKLLEYAAQWVGYCEKKSENHLDSFTENAGRNNYTRFSRDYKEHTGIDVQGQPWCDVFVDECFICVFGITKAKALLHGFSAYTPTSAYFFKEHLQWHSSNPKPGDIIFFENSKRICHTGIVCEVKDGRVFTYEGNTSGGTKLVENGGCVANKSYALSYEKIAGYGRPDYSIVEEDFFMEELEKLKKEFDAYVAHTTGIINTMGQEIQSVMKENERQNNIINLMGQELEDLRKGKVI